MKTLLFKRSHDELDFRVTVNGSQGTAKRISDQEAWRAMVAPRTISGDRLAAFAREFEIEGPAKKHNIWRVPNKRIHSLRKSCTLEVINKEAKARERDKVEARQRVKR